MVVSAANGASGLSGISASPPPPAAESSAVTSAASAKAMPMSAGAILCFRRGDIGAGVPGVLLPAHKTWGRKDAVSCALRGARWPEGSPVPGTSLAPASPVTTSFSRGGVRASWLGRVSGDLVWRDSGGLGAVADMSADGPWKLAFDLGWKESMARAEVHKTQAQQRMLGPFAHKPSRTWCPCFVDAGLRYLDRTAAPTAEQGLSATLREGARAACVRAPSRAILVIQ